jgi:mercuric ion transport protein
MDQDTPSKPRAGALFASGGIVTGLGALIGASCCVLPILLVQAGVSTALVAHLGVFARAKPYLLAVTAALVVAGSIAVFWGGRRPRPRVLILLGAAALLVLGSYAMPYYERDLLVWLRGR